MKKSTQKRVDPLAGKGWQRLNYYELKQLLHSNEVL